MKQADTKSKLFLLFLLGFSISAAAQVANEPDLILQPTELLNQSWNGQGNGAFIEQAGSGNELELLQDQQGAEGHLANAIQSGNWNVAVISQTQQGNRVVFLQSGDLNTLELIMGGSGNSVSAIQEGSGNRIFQQLMNSNQVQGELMQIGNDNEIISVLEGIQTTQYAIRQFGDGLKVIVRQSSF